MDWLANGLPSEGTKAQAHPVSQLLQKEVPTCSLDSNAKEQIERAQDAGWRFCVVVNPQRVVLGLLRSGMKVENEDTTAGRIMEPGPRTYRFNVSMERLERYFQKHPATEVLITKSDGILAGIIRRSDVIK